MDFAVSGDHRVKIKEIEKIDLARELKTKQNKTKQNKTKQKTKQNQKAKQNKKKWNMRVTQSKETTRIENQEKNRDHADHGIVKIG